MKEDAGSTAADSNISMKLCHNSSGISRKRSDGVKRRTFLELSVLSTVSLPVSSEEGSVPSILPGGIYAVIEAVQEHMFPEGSVIPGAKMFHATPFLVETIANRTYDKEIREFVIAGAEELQSRERGAFLTYDTGGKERALRAYEKTEYGGGWLDRIMLLSLEGLLSDPIYGGNFREAGWRSLQTRGGDPGPTVKYIAL